MEGRTDENFIEENSWKYALLDEGQREVGPHEWDPFFSKPKDGSGDSNDSSAEVAKNPLVQLEETFKTQKARRNRIQNDDNF